MIKILRQRKPNRLRHFDYSSSGYYFVTICTKNREEYFGKVINREMILNKYGKIVQKYWLEISDHYRDVALDEFVVMPNHVHGIIVIRRNQTIIKNVGTEQCSVPTNKKFGLLSKIIKSFKEIVVKKIHREFRNYRFQWQRSFYDHIIRNEKSLNEIRIYIRDNPLKWEEDRNNPENLFM